MPTYRNDSENTYQILNSSNEQQIVIPGDSILTFQILDLSGMIKTAEAPYFNPVPASGVHDIISAGGDITINLDSDTDEIEIWNESSADITCFLRAAANTPGLKILENSVRNISALKDQADKVVLQFSAAVTTGQCYLTELKG